MNERKPAPDSIALVIFDVDGVLVDSEVISNRVMVRELGAMGHVFDEAEAARAFTGLSVPEIKARIEAQIGCPLPDDFAERLWRGDRDAFGGRTQAGRGRGRGPSPDPDREMRRVIGFARKDPLFVELDRAARGLRRPPLQRPWGASGKAGLEHTTSIYFSTSCFTLLCNCCWCWSGPTIMRLIGSG